MKKLLPILLILLIACDRKEKEVKPETCTFGLDSSILSNNAAGKRPRKSDPVPIVIPPAPTTVKGVILLDFDGHYFANTHWNWNGPVTVDSANLSAAEMMDVVTRVQRAYDPWQVAVTTSETVFNATPPGSRIRVVLTISHEWYGLSGGTSFVGSFKFTDNTPVFVFTAALGFNIKYIKEAACHEIGHSLGLYHQSVYDANCVKTAEYINGKIMGIGYNVPDSISKWHIGPNSNSCTQIQDDKAIIGSVLKLK